MYSPKNIFHLSQIVVFRGAKIAEPTDNIVAVDPMKKRYNCAIAAYFRNMMFLLETVFSNSFVQDNISSDSDSYYILSMISLVAIVVCVSYVSSEKLDTTADSVPK